jgi:putative endonuclease
MKGGFVYIITNKYNTVLYTGVTSDIVSRTIEHKEKIYPYSFTAKYNCNKLVYFEEFDLIESAIEREKFIKGKVRAYKLGLIRSTNPNFKDLWEKVKHW